jgi:uncharacterized protein
MKHATDSSHIKESESSIQYLERVIELIGSFLPSQGPIEVFVHHNTLHSFEDNRFYDAVEKAAKMYHAEPYLSLARYKEEFKLARITRFDINAVVPTTVSNAESEISSYTIKDVFIESLIAAPSLAQKSQIWWSLYEDKGLTLWKENTSSTEQHRALLGRDLAWSKSDAGKEWLKQTLHEIKNFLPLSHREINALGEELESQTLSIVEKSLRLLWLASLKITSGTFKNIPQNEEKDLEQDVDRQRSLDSLVHPFLVKFSAAFLDQGIASWALPHREEGFFRALVAHLKYSQLNRPWWLTDIDTEKLLSIAEIGATEFLMQELQSKKVPVSEWYNFLLQEALSLKGWAGMMHIFSQRSDMFPLSQASHSSALVQFLAGKVLLEHHAEKVIGTEKFEAYCPRTQYSWEDTVYHGALHIFHLAQTLSLGAEDMAKLSSKGIDSLLSVSRMSNLEQRRLWQQAYEFHFVKGFSDAFIAHNSVKRERKTPRNQAVFCIDDREESLRRYIEEIDPYTETFGTAGFFAVDAEYEAPGKSAIPSCPVGIVPAHRIVESRDEKLLDLYTKRAKGYVAKGSFRFLNSWIASLAGVVAFTPLLLKTLFPRGYRKFKELVDDFKNKSNSSIIFERSDSLESTDDVVAKSIVVGFTIDEMVQRVESLLRSMGLLTGFAPLVAVIGHGSLSYNNPYRSAYECGACGGRPAKMNARVFALMANHPEVRLKLQNEKGILIPATTQIIGGFHNTCDDTFEFFDVDQIPETHAEAFISFKKVLKQARGKNAFERCRRFVSCAVSSEEEAVRHVEERTYNIAEPRPEYNHATNALCVIGRRSLTKHLFLDRRSFLISYDEHTDNEGVVLEKLLGAVTPVVLGINLEYYFSAVDNEVYGAGTKLPHNVTSLLGIVTGYSSDLRTGLPQQMVEIHEPVRLFNLVECSREVLDRIVESSQVLSRVFKNEWVILARYDSITNTIERFLGEGRWMKIESEISNHAWIGSSQEWIRNEHNHLPFASVKQQNMQSYTNVS